MAVPTSGTSNLSMRAIKDEIENNNYAASNAFTNISLASMSLGFDESLNTANASANRPDAQAPHSMSEWYDYDHDLVGIGTPSNITYASTTQAITFTYDEASSTERTYVYLRNLNGSTSFQNQVITDTGDNFTSDYQVVDGSGQSSFTLGDGDDTYAGIKGSPTQISTDLNQNDYLTIRMRGYDEDTSAFGSYTSDFTGWTLPDSPSSFAVSHARTGDDDEWGDGDDGAYTETLSWSAPAGGASSYKVTHGPNNTRDNGANTQDVAVSSGTSLAITGINNLATRYAWVAAVGGNGDTGAYTALGSHQLTETYYNSVFTGPTLSGVISTLFSETIVYSDVLQLGVAFAPGNLEATFQGDTSPGDLYIAISNSDPADGGTNLANANSGTGATGWVQEGSTATLSTGWDAAVSDIAYIRFKWKTHTVSGTNNRTVHFVDSSDDAKVSIVINCVSTKPSDRRLKTNINLVGYSKHLQIPIYTFNYKTDLNTTYKGVMAQDLLEMNFNHAVITDSDGYYSVLYDLIDVDMEKLN